VSLRVQFWGTRGSIPTPGQSTVRYGGNTPCLEVRTADDWLVILDAGTGIRELGNSLIARANGAPITGDIFLTHAHWDHIQGFPFFAPAFRSGNHFTIWGSQSLETNIGRVIRDQMSPVVFPVSFEELDATVDFRLLSTGDRTACGSYEVSAMDVCHPGGALAYRFEEPGSTTAGFAYVSDNELGHAEGNGAPRGWRSRFEAFIRGTRVLVHDATYTSEEYERHRGWGHSTYEEAVDLALAAGVETLVLFHHEPRRGDEELDRQTARCQAMASARGSNLRVIAAAEGLSLTV
jgi:phosphoribosyl 1,2-cyclic phosphodiesterase